MRGAQGRDSRLTRIIVVQKATDALGSPALPSITDL
jgi:hypothetical protein